MYYAADFVHYDVVQDPNIGSGATMVGWVFPAIKMIKTVLQTSVI